VTYLKFLPTAVHRIIIVSRKTGKLFFLNEKQCLIKIKYRICISQNTTTLDNTVYVSKRLRYFDLGQVILKLITILKTHMEEASIKLLI
jgi:hypothetical protein